MGKVKGLQKIGFVFVLLTALVLSACGDGGKQEAPQKSLYEQGLSIISLMEEMVKSDAYIEMYSQNQELIEMAAKAGDGDYTEPKAVYKITVSKNLMQMLAQGGTLTELSPTLREYVDRRMRGMIATQLNQSAGAQALAASSICMVQKTFANDTLDEVGISYLYTYENGFPIVVTFTPGEDNTVSASGSFIFSEDLSKATQEEMEQLFALFHALFSAKLELIENPS